MSSIGRTRGNKDAPAGTLREIEKLLSTGRLVRAFLARIETVLAYERFPKTKDAIASLGKIFAAEFDANLLAAYDGTAALPRQPEQADPR